MQTVWTFWETDRKWTAECCGYGLCVAQLDDSGYYRYALYPDDVEQTQPLRHGFNATLEAAQRQAERFALMYALASNAE